MNIYDYACSSGHEAYSIVMQFISKLGVQKAEKFFPVIAKDYDEFVINMAKTGKFDLDPSEHNLINRVTCGNADDFVKLDHMQMKRDMNMPGAKEIMRNPGKVPYIDRQHKIKYDTAPKAPMPKANFVETNKILGR